MLPTEEESTERSLYATMVAETSGGRRVVVGPFPTFLGWFSLFFFLRPCFLFCFLNTRVQTTSTAHLRMKQGPWAGGNLPIMVVIGRNPDAQHAPSMVEADVGWPMRTAPFFLVVHQDVV